MRVKEAGGSLNNAGRTTVNLNLEDLATGLGNDADEVKDDVLGHHVENEAVGKSVLLASGNRDIVRGGRDVADDGISRGRSLGERTGGLEHTSNEGDVDRLILVVGDIDQGLGNATVDEVDTESSIRESCLDVGLQLSSDGSLGSDKVLGILLSQSIPHIDSSLSFCS